jgi:hypothetical protein
MTTHTPGQFVPIPENTPYMAALLKLEKTERDLAEALRALQAFLNWEKAPHKTLGSFALLAKDARTAIAKARG